MHDENEICLIQNDYDDSFCTDRVNFYDIGAWPTVVSNGVADAWPLTCLEEDVQVNAAIPSPLTISITENYEGNFTAHITAEEDVIDAAFFMVATLAEDVPSSSGTSYLPRHVKIHMTPPLTGDAFTLLSGESVDINQTFTVEPAWDYSAMGVAAWVSRPGGTSISPCPDGLSITANEVLQSRWVPTGDPSAAEQVASGHIETPTLCICPSLGDGLRTITYTLPHAGPLCLGIYDAQGRLMERLAAQGDAGSHTITWPQSPSPDGRLVSLAGVRYVRLDFDGQTLTKEIVLIR